MYFPLVYDEYSSLPPLVLLRVRFFAKIRDQIKKKSALLGFLDEKKSDLSEIGLSSNKNAQYINGIPAKNTSIGLPKRPAINFVFVLY